MHHISLPTPDAFPICSFLVTASKSISGNCALQRDSVRRPYLFSNSGH